MNATQRQALGMLGSADDMARGLDLSAGRYTDLYGEAGGLTSAEQNLAGIARGDSLYGDSRFQDMLADQSAEIADQTNLAFSGAGRYGSAAHAGTLADSVGDFRRDAVLQNYNAERQRQLAANQMIDQARFGRLGMQQGLAGDIANANQMGFQNLLTGGQAALGAGTFQQQQRQAEIDARMKAFQERDMQDWTRLGALQAAASGAAGPYGVTTQMSRQPFNPLGLIGSIFGML